MAVAQTSINCYHESVKGFAENQNERVLAVVKPDRDYSLCELMELTTGIDKSSMSRVVNTLRKRKKLMPSTPRLCRVSGKLVVPSKLFVAEQMDLLQ
jgi:hypothetical protein